MKHSSYCLIVVMAVGFLSSSVAAQEQPRGPSAGGPGSTGSEAGRGGNEIKPYDDVITKQAKTKAGVFLTHQVGDKLYYEIPVAKLSWSEGWAT